VGFLVSFIAFFKLSFRKNPGGLFRLGPVASILKIIMDA